MTAGCCTLGGVTLVADPRLTGPSEAAAADPLGAVAMLDAMQ